MSEVLVGKPRSLISSKRNSEVYAVGDNHVLKLFQNHVPTKQILWEAGISDVIQRAGLPAPRVQVDLVRHHDGRSGIVFERAGGTPLSVLFKKNPGEMTRLTRVLATAHRRIHSWPVMEGLPSQRERMINGVLSSAKLSLADRKKVYQVLERLPDGKALCHGDFHPSNLMVDDDRVMVIDWGGATQGSALCDVARTTILLRYPVRLRSAYGLLLATLYNSARAAAYLRLYNEGGGFDKDEFDDWMLVNAAVRLGENLSARAHAPLEKLVRKRLARMR